MHMADAKLRSHSMFQIRFEIFNDKTIIANFWVIS